LKAAVAVLGLALFVSLVDRVIFQPTPGEDLTPAQVGITAEDVFLSTEDGVRVHAYWLPAPGATRALLFLHGNAGNASHRLPNAAELQRLGAHVLLADYRGYGKSEGTPSEQGVYADARAALAHVTGVRGIAEERVVVFGRSLGGAVAVDLARGRPLAGLILESTFTSVADMAGSLKVFAWLAGRPFDSAATIGELRCPLLFFHGDADQIVPYALGRRLFELAPEPKAFETLRGAGHNDTVEIGGPAYFERIRRFLDDVAPA
jgi:fermentation-respiration switch protein FrsA (DUF1100 family)